MDEQEKKNYSNTVYKKVQQVAETVDIQMDIVIGKKKSIWKE